MLIDDYFTGSYEAMAARGSLQNALIDLTGAPVEESEIHVSDDEKDYFRLIVEELDKKSIICVQTKVCYFIIYRLL